jgi:hypothetical protein
MRPTKALGMFHSWHVSSIELTRMSVRRRIARVSVCDTKERWGASRRTGAEAREDGDGGEGDARRPRTHLEVLLLLLRVLGLKEIGVRLELEPPGGSGGREEGEPMRP